MNAHQRTICLLAALGLGACTTFDEELAGQIPATAQLAATCTAGETLALGTQVVTVGDAADLEPCSSASLAGFAQLELEPKSRVQVSVRPLDGQDVALSVTPGICDGTCDAATDRCPAGSTERLIQDVAADGRYSLAIGVDQPGEVEISINQPTCGNGIREPGETCDGVDGTPSGGACDSECRVVVSQSFSTEQEPNDTPQEANALALATDPLAVRGKLGADCDFDRYLLPDLAAGDIVSATMFDGSGVTCNDSAVRDTTVSLVGGASFDTVIASITGRCPELQVPPLVEAGSYALVVEAADVLSGSFDYTLSVEASPPIVCSVPDVVSLDGNQAGIIATVAGVDPQILDLTTVFSLADAEVVPPFGVRIFLRDHGPTFPAGFQPGLFAIAGANTDILACDMCVVMFGDLDPNTGAPSEFYMAQGGSLNILEVDPTPGSGVFRGVASGLSFARVDTSTGQILTDSCTPQVPNYTFRADVVAAP